MIYCSSPIGAPRKRIQIIIIRKFIANFSLLSPLSTYHGCVLCAHVCIEVRLSMSNVSVNHTVLIKMRFVKTFVAFLALHVFYLFSIWGNLALPNSCVEKHLVISRFAEPTLFFLLDLKNFKNSQMLFVNVQTLFINVGYGNIDHWAPTPSIILFIFSSIISVQQ